MQGYYYTICSLPHLSFKASSPPLTSPTFLPLCAIELGPAAMTVISSITLLPPAKSSTALPLIERWYSGERQLRQELALLRAAQLGREEFTPKTAAVSTFFKTIAQQAMALESPLESENLLNMTRWQILNELESEHNFGLPRLGIYFLKLQLLERRNLFNQQAGQRLRQKIINQITLPLRDLYHDH